MSFVAVQKAYTEATFREAENLTHPHELIQVTLQTLRQSNLRGLRVKLIYGDAI